MSEPVYISSDEALEAVRAAAWTEPAKPEAATCGHPGCTDHPGEGRKMIHVMSGFGRDISLEAAEEDIRERSGAPGYGTCWATSWASSAPTARPGTST